jgi:spermidine synthase
MNEVTTDAESGPENGEPLVVPPFVPSGALAFAAFLSGLCSIIYELLIATTASYFLGDGVLYFSLTIGLYLAAMGAGSFVSRYFGLNYVSVFAWSEVLLAWLGGLSVPLIYFAYAQTSNIIPVYLLLTISIGFVIGLEIPFLARLMERYQPLKENLSNVLSFDYLGALVATLAFPFVMLPWIGVFSTSLVFGIVNLGIAWLIAARFGTGSAARDRSIKRAVILSAIAMAGILLASGQILAAWEQTLYSDRIIHTERSRYQQIVMTRDQEDVRLFLDGNLQFSSVDEYRYHEALVEVPMALAEQPVGRVLLLGAGDGLAAQRVLRHKSVTQITIVDLDPAMTEIGRTHPLVRKLNGGTLDDPKVKVLNEDAFLFLRNAESKFDLIVADLPDPNATPLAKLYSKQMFQLARLRLAPGGQFVTQATSPYFVSKAFWSIVKTMKAAGFESVTPYHAYVPSFGDWGFVLARENQPKLDEATLPDDLKFLTRENFRSLFAFDKDTVAPTPVAVSTIDNPVILSYYLSGWERYR